MSWQFIEQTIRKAGKEHACCECSNPITHGKLYVEISGMWEHEHCRFRRCLVCSFVAQKALELIPAYVAEEDSIQFGGLWSHVDYTVAYDDSLTPLLTTPWLQAHLESRAYASTLMSIEESSACTS